LGKNFLLKKKKKAPFVINEFSQNRVLKMEKGGKQDEKKFLISFLKDFTQGKNPWYAPIPSKQRKKSKKSKNLKWEIKEKFSFF